MATTPQNEEPGFETDVNELPEDNRGAEDRLEDEPQPEDDESGLEEAQEQAAEERKEGGYQ